MRKLTYEFVKNYFEGKGCRLLEKEYIDANTRMGYICECGEESEIRFSAFQNGQRCKKCGIEKRLKKTRFTHEYVKNYFEEKDCHLLEKNYIDANTRMEYECDCGNTSEITFGNFQQGCRCKKCGIKKRSNKRRYTYEYVKNYFEERDCHLLEEKYKNNRTKMEYECECGEKSEITFHKFKQGQRCMNCSGCEKHTLEYVQNCFLEKDCKLLTNEYVNGKTRMEYRCNCGNTSEISFNDFKKGHRCNECGREKTATKQKHTFEFVYNCFKKNGCELLEKKYRNNRMKMKYKCECKNESEITFGNFKKGQRCKRCSNRGYSKESQILFDIVYEKIDEKYKDKTYYATLNGEFGMNYKKKCYKYDYVNSKSKKVIEYNGSAWHATPNLKDNDIGWHALDKNKTAKEARDYEKIKYEGLEKRGFKILTIWDFETKKDFDATVQKCLEFLLN